MKRLSVAVQWLFVIAVLGFVVYVLVRPMPKPDYAPKTWQEWTGVTVLSFAGIARNASPDYPSVKTLEAQLTALRDAGYRTVRPEDVRAYLDERAPLPEKALLLIFEGGRKEAFIRATPLLQRTGFSAVIVVPTTVMDQWGGFYLKTKDIGRLVRLPQWDVGSMGHRAIESAPGFAAPNDGHFLAQRGRTAEGQEESAEAFRDRLLEDYALSARALEDATGKPALLYLYPFAEAGQCPGADPLAEAVNRDAVTRHFSLAFIGGSNPFNGQGSDPWTLNRLRVPGNWPPERLLAELAACRPRNRPQTALGGAQDWVFDREAELKDAEIRIPAGSVAWLRGTDAWLDSDVSAGLRPGAEGVAVLYARYTSPRSWLRVTADAEGLRVQERLGERLYTLAHHAAPADTQTVRRIRLRTRNNRAWVWLDNQPVAENLPLTQRTRRGRVGLGSDQGDVSVSEFSASPLPSRWVLANSIRLVPDDKRDSVQAIFPNWFRAGEPPSLAETAQQDMLQAAVTGIRNAPLLTGVSTLNEKAARAWAAAIDTELLRTNMKMLAPALALDGPAFALADELRNRNYRVVHLLTPAHALEWGRSIAQVTPDEVIAVNGVGEEAERALTWLKRVIPASRLALREVDGAALAPHLSTMRRYESGAEL